MDRPCYAIAFGALVACGARTELGGDFADATSDGNGTDTAVADAGLPDEVSATYCATLAGPVGSCEAGADIGYVIECPTETVCAFFANEWCCCLPNFKGCSCGSPHSACP